MYPLATTLSRNDGFAERSSPAPGSRRLPPLYTKEFMIINRCGSNSPQLAAQELFHYRSPSFPHVFSGNPGETGTGPPIKTFGGDAFGINSHQSSLIPRSVL